MNIYDESSERRSVERRISQLEQQLAVHNALLNKNTEALREITRTMNARINYPAWIASGFAIFSMFGGLLYLAYIKPVQDGIEDVKKISIENRSYLRDIGDYTKETRGIIDGHIANYDEKG